MQDRGVKVGEIELVISGRRLLCEIAMQILRGESRAKEDSATEFAGAQGGGIWHVCWVTEFGMEVPAG